MKHAIVSDIHSNLEALTAVLDEIERQNIDKILCLGDVVGYNASPNECVEIIRERNIISIAGNHDAGLWNSGSEFKFNEVGEKAILWTSSVIKPENLSFIKSLREQRVISGGFLMVHGSLRKRDEYITTESEAWDSFSIMANDSCGLLQLAFFGHTHRQGIYLLQNGKVYSSSMKELQLEEDTLYLINPGSVGQPRDGDERAAFLIYDDEDKLITLYRIRYDIEKAAKKILDSNLPEVLAKRLFAGR